MASRKFGSPVYGTRNLFDDCHEPYKWRVKLRQLDTERATVPK